VINNIFLFGRVVRFIVPTTFDDGRVDRKILSIFRTTRPEKNRKKGLAELAWPSWFWPSCLAIKLTINFFLNVNNFSFKGFQIGRDSGEENVMLIAMYLPCKSRGVCKRFGFGPKADSITQTGFVREFFDKWEHLWIKKNCIAI
jgi:hypothetical protein